MKWKNEFQKISFIFHIWKLNWKMKNEKFFFWICFDLKPISKNKNQNFRIHFLIWNQKINFKKFFHFSIFVLKLKNEKWKIFKIRFVFKSKNELYSRYTDYVLFHFNFKLKIKWHFRCTDYRFRFLKRIQIQIFRFPK